MSRLTSLQILSIIDCLHLEKRCQKDIAPQSAIPDIENIFLEEEEEDFEGKEQRWNLEGLSPVLKMEHILNRLIGLGRKPNRCC
nr:hypothetical protein CFP56_58316 [Quercus suber]